MGSGISQNKVGRSIQRKSCRTVPTMCGFTLRKGHTNAKQDYVVHTKPSKTIKMANSPRSLAIRRMSYLQENNYIDTVADTPKKNFIEPLPIHQEISVVITPASDNSNEVIKDDDDMCHLHNSKCHLWCEKCNKPICDTCISSEHSAHNGHDFCKLEQMHSDLQQILTESQQKLNNLITQLKPLQMETLKYRQRDEELVHELILTKKRSCTEIVHIGEQITKAVDCLERQSIFDVDNPFEIYQAILQNKKNMKNLEQFPEVLKNILHSYSVQYLFDIQVQQGPFTSVEVKPMNSSVEDNVTIKLHKFLLTETAKSCLPKQVEKTGYKNSSNIFVKINLSQNNEAANQRNKTDKDLFQDLKLYFNGINIYNCHYKAVMFFSVFHIHLDNVTLMVDALLEMAMTSFEHCSSLANFCVHLMIASVKTAEWQFVSKSLPSFLLSRCQDEFLKDIYNIQNTFDSMNITTISEPVNDENYVLYKRYKCLIRFIGELYVCGLLKYSFLEFFIENLISRQNDGLQHYEYVYILLFTVGSTLDMTTETSSKLTKYLISLGNKFKSCSNTYIKYLFQYLKDLRKCSWNIRELSYTVNFPPARNESEVVDYLHSVEALALSLNQAVGL